jgi:MFS family permease
MLPTIPFRALAHRNFRLYLFGQGVSVLGTWMQQVAVAWLVYCLTGSAVWLGVIAFAGQIPCLFVAPFAGFFIDRVNRHRMVLFTQTLAMVLAFSLAALTLTGVVEVWQLVVISLLSGTVDAFDIPARQYLMTEMVGTANDLANAIALNSSIFNAARIVGPALAGALLAWTSPGVCFLANGASFFAVLVALLAMRLPALQAERSPHRLLAGIGEGFTYAWGFSPIRALLLLTALVSMAAMASSTLLPVVATSMLHGDSKTLGILTAATGTGALIGTMLLAARSTVVGLGKWIATSPALFGLGLAAFSCAHSLWVSSLCLALAGFALLLVMAASNMVLQTIVEEDKRGRVMSLFTMAVNGLAPIGGLLAGLLAYSTGAAVALRFAGAASILGSLVFALHYPRLRAHGRAIYLRKGLISEPTVAIRTAA